MVTLHDNLTQSTPLDDSTGNDSAAYVIVNEGTDIPPMGISFDMPREQLPNSTKTLLDSVRRLHINKGHPPNAELERIVRLAGGSDIAQQACKRAEVLCTCARR